AESSGTWVSQGISGAVGSDRTEGSGRAYDSRGWKGLLPCPLLGDVGHAVQQGPAAGVAGAEVSEHLDQVRGAELVAHRGGHGRHQRGGHADRQDRKSTRLNSVT